MKVICFILSIYVFALSGVPCYDEGSDNGVETEQASAHSNKHKKDCDCNCCSPFVTCSTCFGFTFEYGGYNFKPLDICIQTKPTFYQNSFIDSYFAKI